MFVEINKDNINELNNSFINKEEVLNDLDNNPFGKYLIYKENDNVIAYIYYSDIYERAEINQIEVSLIHRNCGKGSKILQEFIKTVDKDITLEVNKENIPAIKLYKKYGFIEKAIRKGYYNGIDGLLMERKKTL